MSTCSADLHDDQATIGQWFVAPGQVWCTGAFAHLDQGAQPSVIAELVVESGDLGVVDICDYLELTGTRLQPGDCRIHRICDNATGFAHIGQLCLRLYQPRPVH